MIKCNKLIVIKCKPIQLFKKMNELILHYFLHIFYKVSCCINSDNPTCTSWLNIATIQMAYIGVSKFIIRTPFFLVYLFGVFHRRLQIVRE